MTSHAVLDSNTHRDLRVQTAFGEQFGDAVMSALVVPDEFRQVQAHYPILFRRNVESGEFVALALFGFEQGENLFLKGGEWQARYRPLSVAIQPFLVGRSADGEGPGQVHIDMNHPRARDSERSGEGVRVFDPEGRPTPFLEDIAEKLGRLDVGYRGSQGFFIALREYDLLEPFSLEITLDDGSTSRLVGFHMIDEDKLRALDGATLGRLHAAGHLMPIFMALASLANLTALVERKNARETDG